MKIRESSADRIFNISNLILVTILAVIMMYPLYFVLIASISDPTLVNAGQVAFYPKGITFDGYEKVLQNSTLWRAYYNSAIYMIVGTGISVALTVTAGYALSITELVGRKQITWIFLFTMFFNGGMIPTYLQIRNLQLLDTMWAVILPSSMIIARVIICRTFFLTTLPADLKDSAQIDGCSDFSYFTRIAIPLSKAVIMVMVLYYAVGHWNAYFDAMLYLTSYEKYPLQIILRDILIYNDVSAGAMDMDPAAILEMERIASLIKYSIIVFANLPLVALFPFIQKYFKKGMMIGAVKG